ncbi:fumarylacetoacetate hydrolase domain-containing protein 2-like [Ischnura elegans]|uniref:fumarylacetoacetate hydrolase domain-containing protein 2-like n=1 Tax=Ischnura elegans TaxID=197161 RepID=UPI001ED8BC97|nr:fumarylacetoacetate hydrolase domain-containing protein 2-like [Ischnura elegans]
MPTCGKCLAFFTARKGLLCLSFNDGITSSPMPSSLRKLSFLSSFSYPVPHTRVPSNQAPQPRTKLNLCNRFMKGRLAPRYFSTSSRKDLRFVHFIIPNDDEHTFVPRRLGALMTNDEGSDVVVDISGVEHTIPNDMIDFLKAGPEKLRKAQRVVAEGRSIYQLPQVHLLPAVIKPDKVACVGLNYRDHCEEQKITPPKAPIFFSKWPSCLVGPYDAVEYPSITKNFDYEVEVALIIGRKAKDVSRSQAMNYVFGLSVAQDLTARDWQGKGPGSRNGGQWLLAKATDNSCPIGPAVVQLSSIADTKDLKLKCHVNGTLKQEGTTANMIFSFEDIVSFLSHCCTLLPGDVILTGTPSGVGVFRSPPEFLQKGDVIESEVVGIGKMKNTVI